MILTGMAIIQAIERGQIVVDPFDADSVNPNSLNYRLGGDIYEITNAEVSPIEEPSLRRLVPDDGDRYLLLPGKVYLGRTMEKIGSRKYVTSLIGRSSVGRLGMFLQITADLGQLGDAHCWTLEIEVVSPLYVYRGMKIGQVSFWMVSGEIEYEYAAGYAKFDAPHGHRRMSV